MSANGYKGEEAGKALGDAIAMNTVLKSLDISGGKWDNQKCDAAFIKGFSPGLGANGAMVTVNILGNRIGKEQLSKYQEMMKAHPTLVSLCGVANNATEADLSGLGMDDDDAVILADELPIKGVVSKLDLSQNNLRDKGVEIITGKIAAQQR